MSDDIIKDDGEQEGEEVDVDILEELRTLFAEVEKAQGDLMRFAASIEQKRDSGAAADAVRQVAGNVMPLMSELIGIVAGAMESIDSRLNEVESEAEGVLGEEDAYSLAMVFEKNIRLLTKFGEVATGIEKSAVTELLENNKEAQARVAELSGDDELLEQVRKEVDEALNGVN